MSFVLNKGEETRTVSTAEEARQLLQQGWSVQEGTFIVPTRVGGTGTDGARRQVLRGNEAAQVLQSGVYLGQRVLQDGAAAEEAVAGTDEIISRQQDANTFGALGIAGTAAADAVTFGGYTAARSLLDPEFRSNREAAAAEFSTANTIGQFAGAGLSLLTGVGAVGTANRAYRSLTAGRNLTFGTRAAAGAAEGALGGGLMEVEEAIITANPDRLAERIAMSAATGAIFGLGFEAGGAVLARGRSAISRANLAARDTVGDVLEGAAPAQRATSGQYGMARGLAETPLELGRVGRALSPEADGFAGRGAMERLGTTDGRAVAFRELDDNVSSLLRLGDELADELSVANQAARFVGDAVEPSARTALRETFEQASESLKNYKAPQAAEARRALAGIARAAEQEGSRALVTITNNLETLQRLTGGDSAEAAAISAVLGKSRETLRNGIDGVDLLTPEARRVLDLEGAVMQPIRDFAAKQRAKDGGIRNPQQLVAAAEAEARQGGSTALKEVRDFLRSMEVGPSCSGRSSKSSPPRASVPLRLWDGCAAAYSPQDVS